MGFLAALKDLTGDALRRLLSGQMFHAKTLRRIEFGVLRGQLESTARNLTDPAPFS